MCNNIHGKYDLRSVIFCATVRMQTTLTKCSPHQEKRNRQRLRLSISIMWTHLIAGVLLVSMPKDTSGQDVGDLFRPNQLLTEAQGATTGEKVQKVDKPSYTLAVENKVFVSGFWSNEVYEVSSDSSIKVFAKGNGLDGPWGLAVREGILFVASFATDFIHRYDINTGAFLGAFGGEYELDCPEGMAVNNDGTVLYVASFLQDAVVAYTPEGDYLGVLIASHLKGPEDVAVLPNGDVLVTSHYSDTVVRCTPQGVYLGTFAAVAAPVGITVGFDGHVYVAAYKDNAVARYHGTTGAFVDYFAARGHLVGPSSVSFGSAQILFVSSYDNDKICMYNSTSRTSLFLPSRNAHTNIRWT
eukprot:m.1332069 g.1332069  ORF g.1332069 m.1332069 type:complete len:356 (+) comp24868_c0_seq7:44-1111(+)